MTVNCATSAALTEALPRLRKFAKSLCRDPDRADDLTQQTFLLAWVNIDKFEAGSNMMAWLVTILRNRYFTEYRKLHREVGNAAGEAAEGQAIGPNQVAHVELKDLASALRELPDDMQQAVILIGVKGYSYEEAARICKCSVGTVKSRVHRGRTRLAVSLTGTDEGESPDGLDRGHGAPHRQNIQHQPPACR